MTIKDLFNARENDLNKTSFFNQIASEIKPYGYTLETCYSFEEPFRENPFLEFHTSNNKYYDIGSYFIDKTSGFTQFYIAQSKLSYMNNCNVITGLEQITAMKNAIKVVELLESKDWRLCPSLDTSKLAIAEGVTKIDSYLYCNGYSKSDLDEITFNSNLSKLEYVSFPSSMELVSDYSFKGCINLKEISIDADTYYASFKKENGGGSKASFFYAFNDCPKLSTIRIRGNKEALYSIVFSKANVGEVDYWESHNMRFICDDGEFTYDNYLKEVQYREDMEYRRASTEEPINVLNAYLDGKTIYYTNSCRDRFNVEEGHLFNWNSFWFGGNNEYKVSQEFNEISVPERTRIEALLDLMEHFINGGDIEAKYKSETSTWKKVESKSFIWNIKEFDYRKC